MTHDIMYYRAMISQPNIVYEQTGGNQFNIELHYYTKDSALAYPQEGLIIAQHNDKSYIGRAEHRDFAMKYPTYREYAVPTPNGYGTRTVLVFGEIEFVEASNELVLFAHIDQYGSNERYYGNSHT